MVILAWRLIPRTPLVVESNPICLGHNGEGYNLFQQNFCDLEVVLFQFLNGSYYKHLLRPWSDLLRDAA